MAAILNPIWFCLLAVYDRNLTRFIAFPLFHFPGSNSRSMSNVQQSAVAASTLTATLPRFLSRGHTYRAVVGDTLVLPCQVENLGEFGIINPALLVFRCENAIIKINADACVQQQQQ